ncbi:MAG TPA: GAP family protein, partial [Caldilineaceae bacterium]|nr:GAP family protein [Caldilineaceae bacterium]
LLAGIGLLLAAYYIWRRRPASDVRPELPGWLKTIHQIRPLVALAVGFFLGLVSLKNLVFATAAASQIGQAHLAVTQALLVILIFIVIASLGVASPVYVSFAKGKQAEAILANWEQWLSLNNTTILCVLCLIIGADLLGDGLGAVF